MSISLEDKAYITKRALGLNGASKGLSADHFRQKIGIKKGFNKHKLSVELERIMGGLSDEDADRIMMTNPSLLVPPQNLELGSTLIDYSSSNNELMKLARGKQGRMPHQVDPRVDREFIYNPEGATEPVLGTDGEFVREREFPDLKSGGKVKKPRKPSEWNMFVKHVSKWEGMKGFGGDKMSTISRLYQLARQDGTEILTRLETMSHEDIKEILQSY